jgi:RNA polymerase sigma factor (sigma-70 family)
MPGHPPTPVPLGRRFATTHWSVVLAARGPATPQSRQALAALCEGYWYPLYAYVRRSGFAAEDAQDLTQAFFARLLEKEVLNWADPLRGRFRSFLLGSLKHFLANQRRAARALKRGGGSATLSFDFSTGERRLQLEPSHELTAERVYERRWALTLLERVLAAMRDEYAAAGKQALFDELERYLDGGCRDVAYREIAARLAMSEGAVKVAAHRLRRRYRDRLRHEVAQTVGDAADVEDELRALLRAVAL